MKQQYQPQVWSVVFNRYAASGWARWVPGRFKHVRAYAFMPALKVWVFYDVKFSGTNIFVVPHGTAAIETIRSFIGPRGYSDIVVMTRLPERKRRFPLGNLCTTSLRAVLNLPGGALLPDGFHRDCLANGGKLFEDDDGRVCQLYPAAAANTANAGGPAA